VTSYDVVKVLTLVSVVFVRSCDYAVTAVSVVVRSRDSADATVSAVVCTPLREC
jgi:hypothetical protein